MFKLLCFAAGLPELRFVVGLPVLILGGRSGFTGFETGLSGLLALIGLGGGGRSGGADLVAFLLIGLSVTRGVSASSCPSRDGGCCLFDG